MRIYPASSEEALRARKLLTEWTADGYLSKEQQQALEEETATDLRTTNIFLRLVLFVFTVIAVAAAVGLFFAIFLSRASQPATGFLLLIFAAVSYTAAEVLAEKGWYRHGIEEALAACSVGFLCSGLEMLFFSSVRASHEAQWIVSAVGAVVSLWIWRRFHLWYAFPAAMIFANYLPGFWTSSQAVQHLFVALLYVAGLVVFAPVRARHRFDYLEGAYSLAEAFLWLGLYLILNLQISQLGLMSLVGSPGMPGRLHQGSAGLFYWTTWVLIWCLPPLILARGVRLKDRLILAAGALTTILTFISNKPYLGWPRHTWDPMLLGVALAGVAIYLRRWLAQGPDGVRHGFTAARLSDRDRHAMSVGSSFLGLITPHSVTPAPQPAQPEVQFGGGRSGGGGASGDY
ncbi:hypothetical protein SAMN05421770_101420 [Granulicella rosea]|uniref:DUF2157 domain-containing protein n=1 Tax=Granulicella rosea TaxID=474952 RepID=A0A239DDZ8_9BACT|nr:hypothetical protein [Granulicella rosea]SNS30537.1 hypothetical protein SAMN05421770_101420 [Granulicella rosea]